MNLQKILESKRALRQVHAARPIAEKLRMLDVLREREVAIRGTGTPSTAPGILREAAVPWHPKSK